MLDDLAEARQPRAPVRWTSAMSAITPPSPSLSARMMNVTYFTDTTSVTVQNTSETGP
jgi:hypothetical protein